MEQERERQTTEDSYKPWSDFGEQRSLPSCHFSHMQWDGERKSLKEDKSPIQRREDAQKQENKEKRHSDLYWFGTSLKEGKGEISSVFILKWKTSVYLKFESFRIKRQTKELIEPFSKDPSVTEKMLKNKCALAQTEWLPLCAHTLIHIHPHIHPSTWTIGHRSSKKRKKTKSLSKNKIKKNELHTHK